MTASAITRPEGKHLKEPITPSASGATQAFGVLKRPPLALDEQVMATSVDNCNQLLADTITIRDLYKKHHWQASGPTFYMIHLLYDKHYEEQAKLVDSIAERVQTLGGVSIATGPDVVESTRIPCAPRDREDVETQISRLLHAHEIILLESRAMARESSEGGDFGTNDLIVSSIIRTNELQVWFLLEHIQIGV